MATWRNITTDETGVKGISYANAYAIVESTEQFVDYRLRSTEGFSISQPYDEYPINVLFNDGDSKTQIASTGNCDFLESYSGNEYHFTNQRYNAVWGGFFAGSIERSNTNVPLLVTDQPYDQSAVENAVFSYGSTGDWDTYIQPLIDGGFIFLNEVSEENEMLTYYINNKYGDAVAKNSGVSFSGTIFDRFTEFVIKGKACLYMPTPFEMSIVTRGNVLYSTFSSIGRGIDEVITENAIYYSSPFYNKWDGVTLGNIRVGQWVDTNMTIYDNMDDANDFLNGVDGAEVKALNYDELVNSGQIKPTNTTGIDEGESEFSTPSHNDTFCSRYIMNKEQLKWLNDNYLSNENEIENIINGIRLWGQAKPIEYVIDLTYYPLNLRDICSVTERRQMYFGSYEIEFNSSLGHVKRCDGYKDMGTFKLQPTFYGWRDTEPTQRLFVYLPYVGTYPLDMKRYMNKTINVRYYFDLNTRSCCACLIADGKLMDFWNGQIGIKQSISSTDFSDYANSQINTLLSTARNIAVGGATGGVPGALVGGATGVGELILNRGQEPRVTNMGSSSSIINEFLPQYVYFIFEIMEVDESPNLVSLRGKPSNASGKIGNFSGFLSVAEVDLNCGGATDSEKQEIISLLKNGIRI